MMKVYVRRSPRWDVRGWGWQLRRGNKFTTAGSVEWDWGGVKAAGRLENSWQRVGPSTVLSRGQQQLGPENNLIQTSTFHHYFNINTIQTGGNPSSVVTFYWLLALAVLWDWHSVHDKARQECEFRLRSFCFQFSPDYENMMVRSQ